MNLLIEIYDSFCSIRLWFPNLHQHRCSGRQIHSRVRPCKDQRGLREWCHGSVSLREVKQFSRQIGKTPVTFSFFSYKQFYYKCLSALVIFENDNYFSVHEKLIASKCIHYTWVWCHFWIWSFFLYWSWGFYNINMYNSLWNTFQRNLRCQSHRYGRESNPV